MKKVIFLFVAILFTITGFSEENKVEKVEKADKANSIIVKFSGKVIDSTNGEALVGAAIMIEGSGEIAYTDFEGNFEINNVETSQINLIVSLISYEKIKLNAPAETKNLKVQLKPL